MAIERAEKEKIYTSDEVINRCVNDVVCFNDELSVSILNVLLKDKTSGRNIIWATNSYLPYNSGFAPENEIEYHNVTGFFRTLIQPRVCRTLSEQSHRTRTKAEVFTPGWVCAKMNDVVEDALKDLSWREYVRARCLEITCGEAPFLVSRYDAVTGEIIPIEKRFGLLDRKLQKVNENAATEEEWFLWTRRAFESTYGYEYQGDNLLIARVNLLNTFCDNLKLRWNRTAKINEIKTIANIIVWNIWQMDGLSGRLPDPSRVTACATTPSSRGAAYNITPSSRVTACPTTPSSLGVDYGIMPSSRVTACATMPSSRGAACGTVAISCESGASCRQYDQLTALRHNSDELNAIRDRGDCFATLAMTDGVSSQSPQNPSKTQEELKEDGFCKIYDWQSRRPYKFFDIQKETGKMKFTFVIGNPPYQHEADSHSETNGQRPRTNIFHLFQNAADEIVTKKSVMIYPGKRWMHQFGKGVQEFGKKQLNDRTLSHVIFYPEAREVFGNAADLSDGITIVLKDKTKTASGFKYSYSKGGEQVTVHAENPGDKLMPLNPSDLTLVAKLEKIVPQKGWGFLNDKILSRSLFGIESDFVHKNADAVELYDPEKKFDKKRQIKLLTNDKAGKAGRAKWFVANRDVISQGEKYISEWQVVVSSANAGGQKRDNQLEVIDDHSAFGRSRLALKSFKTEKEAKNFFAYMKSYFIRYTFLLTDEALSSLGKLVPDIGDYTDSNGIIDFSQDIDLQFSKIFELTAKQDKYIRDVIDNLRGGGKNKEMV